MKKVLTLIIGSVMLMTASTTANIPSNPALEIMSNYWLLHHEENFINPYLVNLMALDLMRNNTDMRIIRDYIEWYIEHLNYPDKFGLTGSIYDYKIYSDGKKVSLNKYDSTDSYAATFMLVLYEYYQHTGDKNIFQKYRRRLEDMVYLIPYLQDRDGLTVAIPKTTGKYLMDNCETYAGLTAFIELAREFEWQIHVPLEIVREKLRTGILNRFYNSEGRHFYWMIDGSYRKQPEWHSFYPDAFAQLFPILYLMIPDEYGIKSELWEKFHQWHGHRVEELPTEQKLIYNWAAEVMIK